MVKKQEKTDPAEWRSPMGKSEIRRQILTIRDRLEPDVKAQYDKRIRDYVCTHRAYQESQIILAYVSYQSEVDTIPMIGQAFDDGKYVFAPKVSGLEMEFWQISSLQDLHRGYKGIPEPPEGISFPEWMANASRQKQTVCQAMLWMPGAVFDKERHRIGYGKGFYDRYLGRLYGCGGKTRRPGGNAEVYLTTAALAYTCQLMPELPHEAHDIRPDLLFTEDGPLYTGQECAPAAHSVRI